MTYPVSADDNGVHIQPEQMKVEHIYYCVFKSKAYLVYKDEQSMLNCYEIEEQSLVSQLERCKDDNELERIFEDYLNKSKKS